MRINAEDLHRTACRFRRPGAQIYKGAFPRAVRPENTVNCSPFDREVDAFKHLHITIILVNVLSDNTVLLISLHKDSPQRLKV